MPHDTNPDRRGIIAPGGLQHAARDLMVARISGRAAYASPVNPGVEIRHDAVESAANWSAARAREIMLRRQGK